jgi:hypothetical protein
MSKFIKTILSIVFLCDGLHGYSQKKLPLDYVDPFISTSTSRWILFTGATMPNGMVKLSHDNQGNVWQGGYEYR